MVSVDLSTRDCDGQVIVALRGVLDAAEAVRVAAALTAVAARERHIIIDLAGLEFIDSSGVAALVRGRRQARNAGGELLLAAPQQQVLGHQPRPGSIQCAGLTLPPCQRSSVRASPRTPAAHHPRLAAVCKVRGLSCGRGSPIEAGWLRLPATRGCQDVRHRRFTGHHAEAGP
jgi:anti-sigma B factor antagonist